MSRDTLVIKRSFVRATGDRQGIRPARRFVVGGPFDVRREARNQPMIRFTYAMGTVTALGPYGAKRRYTTDRELLEDIAARLARIEARLGGGDG